MTADFARLSSRQAKCSGSGSGLKGGSAASDSPAGMSPGASVLIPTGVSVLRDLRRQRARRKNWATKKLIELYKASRSILRN